MALQILLGLGAALLVVGFGLAWLPLAFIAAGCALIGFGFLIDFDDAKTKTKAGDR